MAKQSSKEFNLPAGRQVLKKLFVELEEISSWFQNPDIDLDEALKKYQCGMKLVKEAQAHLKQTENEFRAVVKQTKE